MTLYEINEQILACLDEDTGEIINPEQLDALQLAKDEKLENIGLYIKNLTSEIEAIRSEEKALAERRKAKENKVERLTDYLAWALDGQAFETARMSVKYTKSKALEVTDQELLTYYLENMGFEHCLKYSLPEVKKAEVTKLMKEGVDVPAVQLVERQSLKVK